MSKVIPIALSIAILMAIALPVISASTGGNFRKYSCRDYCEKRVRTGEHDLDLCLACCDERDPTDACQRKCTRRAEPVKCSEYGGCGDLPGGIGVYRPR
jgi:hypothetical protein